MPRLSAPTCSTEVLTAAERELIRRELGVRCGSPPRLAEGIFLQVWRSGPLAGQPKVPAAVQSMVDRGLPMIRAGSARMARAHFTEVGLAGLSLLVAQSCGLDPLMFAHIRRELDLETLAPSEQEPE